MSSKRKKMNSIKRLTRSQSKAKKAIKATTNIVPTDTSVSGYTFISELLKNECNLYTFMQLNW